MLKLWRYPNYLSGIDGYIEVDGGVVVHFKNSPFLYFYNYNRRMLQYATQWRGLNTWINKNKPSYSIYNDSYQIDTHISNVIRINSDGNRSEVKDVEISPGIVHQVVVSVAPLQKLRKDKIIKNEGLMIRGMLRSKNTFLQTLINTTRTYKDFQSEMRRFFPAIYVKFSNLKLSDGMIWSKGL